MSAIALTHDEILKVLCDNAPLSDDQRAALVSLVSADKRGQELWDCATRWQPIETAPQDGRTVLLGYANSHGRWRTLRGQWMSQEFIDENWEEPDSGDWDVFVETETLLGPRGVTRQKRDAVNFAYRIAMSYGRCRVTTVDADPSPSQEAK